jgi:hypothetical protein
MRQISIILATAVIAATVTVAGMMAFSSSSTHGVVARGPGPINVMKMMRDAKDLPNESYPAH